MRQLPRSIALFLDLCIAALLAVAVGYVGHAAGRAILAPAFRSQVLEPQQKGCVIREDVCKLVGWLRDHSATTLDTGLDLTPEVTQRAVELAFPIRVMRGAPVLIDLCRSGKPGEQPRLRVTDVKRATDSNADLCIFDRR